MGDALTTWPMLSGRSRAPCQDIDPGPFSRIVLIAENRPEHNDSGAFSLTACLVLRNDHYGYRKYTLVADMLFLCCFSNKMTRNRPGWRSYSRWENAYLKGP